MSWEKVSSNTARAMRLASRFWVQSLLQTVASSALACSSRSYMSNPNQTRLDSLHPRGCRTAFSLHPPSPSTSRSRRPRAYSLPLWAAAAQRRLTNSTSGETWLMELFSITCAMEGKLPGPMYTTPPHTQPRAKIVEMNVGCQARPLVKMRARFCFISSACDLPIPSIA